MRHSKSGPATAPTAITYGAQCHKGCDNKFGTAWTAPSATSSINGKKPKKKKTPKHKETNTYPNINPRHHVHHTTTSRSRATIGKKAHASARPKNPDPLPTS
jgi:hypothetical protein